MRFKNIKKYSNRDYNMEAFSEIFQASSVYEFNAYFGKSLLEEYLNQYVSEKRFIAIMMENGFKYNQEINSFKVKLDIEKAINILGMKTLKKLFNISALERRKLSRKLE